jgi:AcrR family transcriptional regulator
MARPPGHGPGFETRRRAIVDVAAALFAQKGYAGTGIAELCTATGLAKGALYHYIGSKEALLVEIQDGVLVPLLAAARRIQGLDEHPVLRLRLLSETLLEVIAGRLDHISVVEHDLRQLSGDARTRLLSKRRAFESVVSNLLAEGMAVGALRRMDPRLATLQFFNLHNYSYQWLRPDGEWTPTHLAGEYCSTLLGGFSAPGYDAGALEAAVGDFRARYRGASLGGL